MALPPFRFTHAFPANRIARKTSPQNIQATTKVSVATMAVERVQSQQFRRSISLGATTTSTSKAVSFRIQSVRAPEISEKNATTPINFISSSPSKNYESLPGFQQHPANRRQPKSNQRRQHRQFKQPPHTRMDRNKLPEN